MLECACSLEYLHFAFSFVTLLYSRHKTFFLFKLFAHAVKMSFANHLFNEAIIKEFADSEVLDESAHRHGCCLIVLVSCSTRQCSSTNHSYFVSFRFLYFEIVLACQRFIMNIKVQSVTAIFLSVLADVSYLSRVMEGPALSTCRKSALIGQLHGNRTAR